MSTGFNVDRFKSNVGKNSFVQTNKYDFSLTTPMQFSINENGQNITFSDITKDLGYRCINATLPGVAIRTIDSNRYGLGVIEKMPYVGNYTDISFTFLCDRYGYTYKFWYAWLNYIFSVNGKDSPAVADQSTGGTRSYYTAEYKDNYAATIKLNVYDNGGNTALAYTLYKAYPTSINDTSVSWGERDNLLKLTTTLTFREWAFENTTATRSLNGGFNNLRGGNGPTQIPAGG